jgi:hypothetical protein
MGIGGKSDVPEVPPIPVNGAVAAQDVVKASGKK